MRAVVIVVLTMLGCGSDDEAGSQGPCLDPRGTYEVVTRERAPSDCGPLPDQVIILPSATDPMDGCVEAQRADDAVRCTSTVKLSCPLESGGTGTATRFLNWTRDGASATGTMNVLLNGADYTCSSTYDVTYRRVGN